MAMDQGLQPEEAGRKITLKGVNYNVHVIISHTHTIVVQGFKRLWHLLVKISRELEHTTAAINQ